MEAIVSQRLFRNAAQPGRVAATEILINNAAIKNLIRNEKMHQIQNVLQTSRDQGMHTMEMDIRQKVKAGFITRQDADPYLSKTE